MSADRRRLIVVSNRGPVTYGRDAQGRTARRGGGGLVTALGPLVSRHEITWIANAMTDEDHAVAAEAGGTFDETGRDGSPYRLRLVTHDPADFDRFYNEFANPALWFLQHELWDLAGEPRLDEAWESYRRVNEAIAARGDRGARRRTPTGRCGSTTTTCTSRRRSSARSSPRPRLSHFVHIPWPDPAGWAVLPDEVVARDPRRAAGERRRRLPHATLARELPRLGRGGSRRRGRRRGGNGRVRRAQPLVTAHPISVDTREFDELAGAPTCSPQARELERIRCERLILRVDRTDPVEEHRPRLRGIRGVPRRRIRRRTGGSGCSRCSIRRGRTSRSTPPIWPRSRDAAREVNDRFGRDGWEPVGLEIRDDFPRSVAAYKQYDVLLVNAVSDGLNLVAKEAPLVNERDGVVVLSPKRRRVRGARAVGRRRRPIRRRRPGGGAARGALALGGRAPLAGRGDPRARPGPRPDGMARPPAGRPGPGLGPHLIDCRPGRAWTAPEKATELATIALQWATSRTSTRPATSAWSTSAASRSPGGVPSLPRPCGWRPRRRSSLRELPKGDALVTAQLAGVMAAKRTADLIPLCHPLPLSHVELSRRRSARTPWRSRRPSRRPRRPASRWRRWSRPRSPRSPSTTWRRRSTRRWSIDGVRLLEKTKEPV